MDGVALLAYTCRFLLGLVLAAAGVAKIANVADFREAVTNYRLLPQPLVRPVAAALPFVEMAAGGLLLVGAVPRIVAATAATLLTAFTLAVAVNLARGRVLDCGCFGAATPRRLSWWTVARNLVLAAMALGVFVGRPGGAAIPMRTSPASPPPVGDVLAAGALAFLLVLGALVASEAAAIRRRLSSMPPLDGPEAEG